MKHAGFAIAAIIIVSCAYPPFTQAHNIHISYCKATAAPEMFTGKVTYYKDDFFLALKNWRGSDSNAGSSLSNNDWTRLKLSFMQEKLRAVADGSLPIALAIDSTGEDASSIWFYFRFAPPQPMHTIIITHTLLFGEYMDQTNIMMIHTDAKDCSHVFVPSDSTYALTF